jgi:outer membrane biosynthesis protein TonB
MTYVIVFFILIIAIIALLLVIPKSKVEAKELKTSAIVCEECITNKASDEDVKIELAMEPKVQSIEIIPEPKKKAKKKITTVVVKPETKLPKKNKVKIK